MRTKLAARAAALSERIYTSLPWGYRIARLFLKLSDASEFGPAFYTEFIIRGVSGMDEIDGKDASTYRDMSRQKLASLLQRKRYGRDFGQKLFATALRKLKSVELVEDSITDYFVKLQSGQGMGDNIREGTALDTAEGYAITGVLRTGFDIIKKKNRERPTLVKKDESGVETIVTLRDPRAFKEFASMLDRRDFQKAMREVERFHPREGPKAAFWATKVMKGWKEKEIAHEMGFKHPTQLGELKRKYWLPALREIFEKYRRKAM